MSNYLGEMHFDRLTDAVHWSYDQQRDGRKVHHSIIRHMMGEYYPILGQENEETAINLLSLAYRAWGRFLIARNPRVLAITQNPLYQALVFGSGSTAGRVLVDSLVVTGSLG